MSGDLSKDESAAIIANAVDVRPTENFHSDPALSEKGTRKAGELTAEESEAIMRLATDMRPGETFLPEDDGQAAGKEDGAAHS
jgi:hypothetical protein